MDKRKKFLLSELSSGDVEAMERAATLISKNHDVESIKKVLKFPAGYSFREDTLNTYQKLKSIKIVKSNEEKHIFRQVYIMKRLEYGKAF